MSTRTSIDYLPEELLVCIFGYVDEEPPSRRNIRLEPSLDLTDSSDGQDLKHISKVSRRFRRIALPLLFRFARLRLHVVHTTATATLSQSSASVAHSTSSGIDPTVDGAHRAHSSKSLRESLESSTAEDTLGQRAGSAFKRSSLDWATRIHDSINDFLSFVQAAKLAPHVQSFVLMSDHMIEKNQSRFPHRLAASSDFRYRAAAELWHQLLGFIPTLRRCVIVAPPADLACLANCAIDLFGDWAFEGMDFHILELALAGTENSTAFKQSLASANEPLAIETEDNSALSYVPSEYPGIAASSILKLRPWAHLGLNEGSFLRAYATYEYFERGPPSLIYSIKDCLASSRRIWRSNSQGGMDLTSLVSFTYTAILPFAHHCDFRGLLPYIDELDVKLAPDPSSDILKDQRRVGRAPLEDCWQELIDAYRAITRPFQTFAIQPDGSPKLKRFVCGDMGTRALVSDLDDEFVPLCLPVWAEMEPGVFVRQQSDPPMYPLDTM